MGRPIRKQQMLKDQQQETNHANKQSFEYTKQILRESAMDSTSHGIPHIFKRQNISLKIFWFICFNVSALICFFMISKTIVDYLQYETVSRTETIYEIPSEFPTVSICNLNPFQTNNSIEFVNDILVRNNLDNMSSLFLGPLSYSTIKKFRYFTISNAANPNITDATRKALGMQLEDMLLSCTFNLEPCNSSEFQWYYDGIFGSCYIFNSGKNSNGYIVKNKFSQNAGPLNGLVLELFVGDPGSLTDFSVSTGAHVMINNKVYY